jgi:alkylation response protein AidB-like acyl-CoA dehydrogenase
MPKASDMYNLRLSAEQLEIRDTVRDFVEREIKPVMLKADRLDVRDRSLPMQLIDQASQLGMRTLALSEDRGGAGADALTCCIVTEELAAGDADIAALFSGTLRLGYALFDQVMTDAQRDRFLPAFLENDRYHLAVADREGGADTRLGVNYHRPVAIAPEVKTAAAKANDGSWLLNGSKDCVANAPLAGLFAVEVKAADAHGTRFVLVPADTPGLTVRARERPWTHGPSGDLELKDCRVPADHLLDEKAGSLLAHSYLSGRGTPLFQALNLGIARAAYDAAVDYVQIRIQGGRPLAEHQAIATKLADTAIRIEVARAAIWQAAWASDHAEAYDDRSLSDMPLQTIVEAFTGEMMLKVAKDAAEVFGAMGVMRDMPMQKYVHDARVCLHTGDGAGDAKLRIAEAIFRYRRPSDFMPRAAE